MTQPKPSMDSPDPSESIQALANEMDDQGFNPVWGNLTRTLDPDNDPTEIGGTGAFGANNVASAIVTTEVERLTGKK